MQAERRKEDERRQLEKQEREEDQRNEEERRQQDQRRKEEERQQEENRKEKLWEAMMERLTTPGTTSSTPHVVHAMKESSSVSDWDKVPKFRKLEVEEDVDAYLGAYEAHMDSYSMSRTQWSKHLAPILNPDATEVYMAMESEDRKNYDSLKEALYAHYNVSKETYRRKMEQLRRKSGESWTVCGKRYKSLVRKWISGCETVENIVELLAVDAIRRLMPVLWLIMSKIITRLPS